MKNTIEILINNQKVQLEKGCCLQQAVQQFGAVEPYALVFNSSFSPKSEHLEIVLKEHDQIEIISAIQGG